MEINFLCRPLGGTAGLPFFAGTSLPWTVVPDLPAGEGTILADLGAFCVEVFGPEQAEAPVTEPAAEAPPPPAEDFLGDENTVNVHVSNLRAKLSKADPDRSYIKTVWGIGFKLAEA